MIIARSYAKVNIGLKIMARRSDGYHDLDTYFHRIELCDDLMLEVEEARKTAVWIVGNDDYLPYGAMDLMEKAALLFSHLSGKQFHLFIRIEKRIPVQGGLGGGSSNASTVLTVLNRFFGSPLSQEKLMEASLLLGSDVPFFTSGLACAYGRGRGEILEEREAVVAPILIVMRRGDKVATGRAFQAADVGRVKAEPLPPWTTDVKQWQGLYRNDFDFIQPILGDEVFLSLAKECTYHGTSGSGAAQLLVFTDDSTRDRVHEAIGRLAPSYISIPSKLRRNIT